MPAIIRQLDIIIGVDICSQPAPSTAASTSSISMAKISPSGTVFSAVPSFKRNSRRRACPCLDLFKSRALDCEPPYQCTIVNERAHADLHLRSPCMLKAHVLQPFPSPPPGVLFRAAAESSGGLDCIQGVHTQPDLTLVPGTM